MVRASSARVRAEGRQVRGVLRRRPAAGLFGPGRPTGSGPVVGHLAQLALHQAVPEASSTTAEGQARRRRCPGCEPTRGARRSPPGRPAKPTGSFCRKLAHRARRWSTARPYHLPAPGPGRGPVKRVELAAAPSTHGGHQVAQKFTSKRPAAAARPARSSPPPGRGPSQAPARTAGLGLARHRVATVGRGATPAAPPRAAGRGHRHAHAGQQRSAPRAHADMARPPASR